MRIAIVDDEKGILLSLGTYLQIKGHKTYTFDSPLEAVKKIPELEINLIILDMRMPMMNGDELACYLKSHPKTRHIPIILFSANATLSEIAEKVGAQGILEKPFRFEKLDYLIEELAI